MKIENAKIDSTMLGYEGHQILTCYIYLGFDGASQGFGGYAISGIYCAKWIEGILNALEVDTWEKLKGLHVRSKSENGKLVAIGHIIKDKWFNPDELLGSLK